MFILNNDTAFMIVNPIQEDRLFKYIMTRISREPRTVIACRK